MSRAHEAAMAFRYAVMHEDLDVRDQLGTELDEFQDLLKLGDQAVEPLLSMLTDEEAHVRCTIAGALYHFACDSRIVGPLIATLNDPDPAVRAAAAIPLADSGHIGALDALIAACRDSDDNVRFQAIQALRDFKGCQSAIDAIADVMRTDSKPRNRMEAGDFLLDMGAFAELRIAIADGLEMDKRTIARVLGEVGGDGALEYLVLLLRSGGDKEEHARLLASASELPGANKGMLDSFANLMIGNDAFAQREAALALGKLGDPRAIGYLRSAADHPHYFVRAGAAQALYMLDREAGVEAALRLLESSDEQMLRWMGPLGFGCIGDTRISDKLIGMLSGTDGMLRQFAAKELMQSHDIRAIGPLKQGAAQGVLGARKALENLGYRGPVEGLADRLATDDVTTLMQSARTLASFPDPSAVEPLIEVLHAGDVWVAEDTIIALGAIADARATSALTNIALSSDDVRLRKPAAWALTQIHTDEAEQAVLGVVGKGDIGGASRVHAYLLARGEPGTEGLMLDILRYYGHKAIAEDYANCGNPALAEAGCKWLEDHPFSEYHDYSPWGKVSGAKWASVQGGRGNDRANKPV